MKTKLLFSAAYIFIFLPTAFADFIDILPRKQHIIGSLPAGDATTHFLPRIIDIMMKGAYTISTGFMIVAALMYFVAYGDDGQAEKAKKILYYSAIGFIIITVSYAIVQGVTHITFNL